MQCCVPFCKTTAQVVSESTRITFYEFPREVHLRAAWLRALGTQDNLPDCAVVCSQHFLHDDIYETESGSNQICSGAIPSTVQVCMICFDTQSKLYPMSKYKLDEAYQHLVGHPLFDQGNLKQTLCVQCAQRLVNFNKFRDKSLRARSLMIELVEKHKLITMQHSDIFNKMNKQLKHNIVPTVLKPDHCDLYINTDKQTDVLSTVKPIVKSEVSELSHESMSVDEDVTEHNVVVRNVNTENSLNINLVVTKEEYVSDEELKQTTDPLFVKPSTSKDEDDVPLAKIKYEITFECSVCSEEFADEESYNNHMTEHMEENQNLAEDSAECGQPSVTPLPLELVTTEQGVSSSETIAPVKVKEYVNSKKPFTCTRCYFKTAVELKFVEHMITHTQTGARPFSCDECFYRFFRKSDLDSHIKTHTGHKPFACVICDFRCARKGHLVVHMRTHTDVKPFICDVCCYKFGRYNELERHMKTHTGEKPIVCEVCDYRCVRRSYLLSHMKTHTGERPNSCELCEYKCKRKGDLVRHMKIHNGASLYSCELCEYSSIRKSDVVRHKRSHTIESPISCELCEFLCTRKRDLVKHLKMMHK